MHDVRADLDRNGLGPFARRVVVHGGLRPPWFYGSPVEIAGGVGVVAGQMRC